MAGQGQEHLTIDVLGPVSVLVDGAEASPGPRPTQLLLRLFVAGGRPVADGVLLDEVWHGEPVSSGVLKSAVNRLRDRLGAAGTSLVRQGNGYALIAEVSSDMATFESLVDAARRTDDPFERLTTLDRALALWRGPVFGGFDDGAPWLTPLVERLRVARELASTDRLATLLELGRADHALPELAAASEAAPYDERLVELHARARYLSGQPVEALRVVRTAAQRLRDDLGLRIGPRLMRLESQLLSHEVASADTVDDRVVSLRSAAENLRLTGATAEALRLSTAALDAARELAPERLPRELVAHAMLLAFAGRASESKPLLREAASLARQRGDGRDLTLVALAEFGFGVTADDHDELLVSLTEPLAYLAEDAPERVELLSATMHHLLFTGGDGSIESLLDNARHLASTTNNRRSLATARAAESVLRSLRPDASADPVSLAETALAEARDHGSPTVIASAYFGWLRAMAGAGRYGDIEDSLPEVRAVANRTMFPFAWVRPDVVELTLQQVRGDLLTLPAAIEAVKQRGEALGLRTIAGQAGRILLTTLLEADQLELVLLGSAGAHGLEREHFWPAFDAFVATERGVAGAELKREAMMAMYERGVPNEEPAVFGAAFAIDAAHRCGDVALAAVAVPVVEAFPASDMVLGYVTSTLGPTARPIALAWSLLGRRDEALDLLERTTAHCRSQRAELWAARCELAMRDVLRRSGEAADGHRADRLTGELRGHPLMTQSPRFAREVG